MGWNPSLEISLLESAGWTDPAGVGARLGVGRPTPEPRSGGCGYRAVVFETHEPGRADRSDRFRRQDTCRYRWAFRASTVAKWCGATTCATSLLAGKSGVYLPQVLAIPFNW